MSRLKFIRDPPLSSCHGIARTRACRRAATLLATSCRAAALIQRLSATLSGRQVTAKSLFFLYHLVPRALLSCCCYYWHQLLQGQGRPVGKISKLAGSTYTQKVGGTNYTFFRFYLIFRRKPRPPLPHSTYGPKRTDPSRGLSFMEDKDQNCGSRRAGLCAMLVRLSLW